MKAKRVLALILSVAMFMTSGELPVKASAMTDTAETVSFVSEGDPDAAVWDVSGEQEGAVDVSGSDETADDVSGSDRANVVDSIEPLYYNQIYNTLEDYDIKFIDTADLVGFPFDHNYLTEYAIEIERMVMRLESLSVETV